MIRTSYDAPKTLARRADWRDDAECARPAYADRRDLWFAHTSDTDDVELAKGICNTLCPVRRACLTAAMREEGGAALDRRFGIRGGLTGGQRLSKYRRQAAARDVTPAAGPVKTKRGPAECGTRSGYQKHVREKTEICPPCRQANTDADNRLRRTGTTKVLT